MRELELLAPAKNLECGLAAIDHGADAVYIGADRYGARAAAGNSIDDIRQLCSYAHRFSAKVYVTVNTILYDHELADTQRLVSDLGAAGVDAILVQDMGLLRVSAFTDFPALQLHPSTQTCGEGALATLSGVPPCSAGARAVCRRDCRHP